MAFLVKTNEYLSDIFLEKGIVEIITCFIGLKMAWIEDNILFIEYSQNRERLATSEDYPVIYMFEADINNLVKTLHDRPLTRDLKQRMYCPLFRNYCIMDPEQAIKTQKQIELIVPQMLKKEIKHGDWELNIIDASENKPSNKSAYLTEKSEYSLFSCSLTMEFKVKNHEGLVDLVQAFMDARRKKGLYVDTPYALHLDIYIPCTNFYVL